MNCCAVFVFVGLVLEAGVVVAAVCSGRPIVDSTSAAAMGEILA